MTWLGQKPEQQWSHSLLLVSIHNRLLSLTLIVVHILCNSVQVIVDIRR